MMARISARRLRLSLGGRHILDGIDLDFAPGRVHSILRPSGCDKTTLIRALSGALRSNTGEVCLDDTPIRALSPAGLARVMAVVWQGDQVSGDATVQHLVGYGHYAYLPWWRLNPSGRDPVIKGAMAVTGVTHLSHRLVVSLSGGGRQRAQIAMALARQPRILLLDEPTTYLGTTHQLDVLELIRGLNQRNGFTVITVLHSLAQAVRYCDRCAVMGGGWVRTDGVPAKALSVGQVERNFAVNAWVTTDPSAGHPVIVPRHRASTAPPENREAEGAP